MNRTASPGATTESPTGAKQAAPDPHTLHRLLAPGDPPDDHPQRRAPRPDPHRTDKACGNCGAPAKVGMTGACEHCGAHVTSGEFDWVLSKIEQDDSYRG